MRVRSYILMILALAMFAGGGRALGEDRPASREVVRALQRAATACASVRQDAAVKRLAGLAPLLGLSERDERVLAKAVERAVRKAAKRSPRPSARQRALKDLQRALPVVQAALRERLAAAPDEAKHVFARVLVWLDPNDPAGAATLGRVEVDGVWMHPDAARVAKAAAEHLTWVAKARRLEFRDKMTVERVDSPVPGHWPDGVTRVGIGKVGAGAALWSGEMPAAEMKIYLNQALKSLALMNAMLGKGLEPHLGSTQDLVIFTRRADERAAFQRAKEAGRIDPVLIPAYENGQWHYTKDGYHHAFRNMPTTYGREMLYLIGRASLRHHYGMRMHAGICMGLMNWSCFMVQGIPMARYLKVGATATADRRYAHEEDATWKRFLVQSKAGLAGMRRWLELLARRGQLPPFEDGYQDQVSKIEGDVRTLFTFFAKYLAERGELHDSMAALSEPATKVEAHAALVKLHGKALAAQVDDFVEWLLGRGFGRGRPLIENPAFRSGSSSLATTYPQAEAARVYLNKLRATALPEDDRTIPYLDEALCEGGALHLEYLKRNPDQQQWPNVHMELPDLEGFTPEGSRVGLNSIIFRSGSGPTTAREIIDWALATLYHRLPLLQPDIMAVGCAVDEKGWGILDAASMREWGNERTPYVLWPPPDASDVLLAFGPEMPNPVPGEDMAQWGYPVTVQRYRDPGVGDDLPHTMRMVQGASPSGESVDCWFISPTNSYHPNVVLTDVWCLIPKRRLRPRTTYTVELSVGGKPIRTWSFRTGRDPGFYAR